MGLGFPFTVPLFIFLDWKKKKNLDFFPWFFFFLEICFYWLHCHSILQLWVSVPFPCNFVSSVFGGFLESLGRISFYPTERYLLLSFFFFFINISACDVFLFYLHLKKKNCICYGSSTSDSSFKATLVFSRYFWCIFFSLFCAF